MKYIEEQYLNFINLNLPRDATDIQKYAIKIAFYAGAQSILRLNMNMSRPDICEVDAMKMIGGAMDEVAQFITTLYANKNQKM